MRLPEPAPAPPAARALVVALLALHAVSSVAPALTAFRNDFLNYYLPARARWEGRPLDRAYERLWMSAEAERAGVPFVGLFMPNPPPNALVLLPLAGLPPATAKAVWTVLLACALAATFLVLRRTSSASPWLTALAFLVPSSAMANALAYGPPYPLLLLLIALALAAQLRGREWACGLLLAPVAALKLYGLALLAYFVWTRRWRAAAGMVAGAAALTAVSLAALGGAVHPTYLREMLPPSLEGRVIDPYSPFWQTIPAVSRRLFQLEPELNPWAVADRPVLAAALARFTAAAVLAASVLMGRRTAAPERVRREWAVLLLASLAVSPMTASYHLVLLILPCALLVAERGASLRGALLVLALLAFAASPLPHAFAPLARGWGNVLACPRLLTLLGLWLIAARPLLSPRALVVGAVVGLACASTALAHPDPVVDWTRVAGPRGLLVSEPLGCAGVLYWVAPEGPRYVVLGGDGSRRPGDTVRCMEGRLLTGRAAVAAALGAAPEADLVDVDRRQDLTVSADDDGLRERVAGVGDRPLVSGRTRWPRISPDGTWIVYQAWESGSWDIHAVERASGAVVRVAVAPSNETEPSWSAHGARVLFLSDRRRGLFGAAVYSVAAPAGTQSVTPREPAAKRASDRPHPGDCGASSYTASRSACTVPARTTVPGGRGRWAATRSRSAEWPAHARAMERARSTSPPAAATLPT